MLINNNREINMCTHHHHLSIYGILQPNDDNEVKNITLYTDEYIAVRIKKIQ